MSQAEGSERVVRQQLMHLSFPNETPEEEIVSKAGRIAGHLFQDPEVGQPTIIGTVVWVDVNTTGLKPLKLKTELSDEELELRTLTLEHFVSIE